MTTGIRHRLIETVPLWLQNRLGLNTGFKFLWCIALVCDALADIMLAGFRAAMPGLGTPTALPTLGQARGLFQGPNEPTDHFVNRLIGFLDAWKDMGSAEQLALQIQAQVMNATETPKVRVVDRAGNFVTAYADGHTDIQVDATWNWDSAITERSGWWSDVWVIIYTDQFPVYTGTLITDVDWIASWGNVNGQGWGTGHRVPRVTVDAVLKAVHAYKAAHCWVEALIWTNGNTLFVPGSLGGNPDGTWGNWSKLSGTDEVAARPTNIAGASIAYWVPRDGG